MATEAWHSLTENIKPKAVFRLCLIQTEAKFTFGVLGGGSGRWAHLGTILEPSWAYLEPFVGHLRPSWGHVGPLLGHLRLIRKASGTIRCHLRATLQRAGNESAVQGMYSVFLQVGEASHNFFRQP